MSSTSIYIYNGKEISHEVIDLKPYRQSTSSIVVSVLLKRLANALLKLVINIILELLVSNICIPKYWYGISIGHFLPKSIGIGC